MDGDTDEMRPWCQSWHDVVGEPELDESMSNPSFPSYVEDAFPDHDFNNGQYQHHTPSSDTAQYPQQHTPEDLLSNIGTALGDAAVHPPGHNTDTRKDPVADVGITPISQGPLLLIGGLQSRQYGSFPAASADVVSDRPLEGGQCPSSQLDRTREGTAAPATPPTQRVRTYAEVAATRAHRCPYPDCGRSWDLQGELTKHLSRAHIPKGKQKCICQLCSQRFNNEKLLKRHKEEVHDKCRYHCTVCERDFYRADPRKKHMMKEHPGADIPDRHEKAAPHVSSSSPLPQTPHRQYVCERMSAPHYPSTPPSIISSLSFPHSASPSRSFGPTNPRLLPPTPTSMSRNGSLY